MEKYEDMAREIVFCKDGTMKSCFLFGSTKEFTAEMLSVISDALRETAEPLEAKVRAMEHVKETERNLRLQFEKELKKVSLNINPYWEDRAKDLEAKVEQSEKRVKELEFDLGNIFNCKSCREKNSAIFTKHNLF